MPTKRPTQNAEHVLAKLREAEQMLREGANLDEVCRWLGVDEETYYAWRERYGGMRLDQAKRVAKLENENARLRRLLAEARTKQAAAKPVREK